MNPDLDALLPDDRVEIIIHRKTPSVRARVHASYIPGHELKACSDEAGGRILLNAVARCSRAIAGAEPVAAKGAA
jgi:hypothetical protein